MAIKVEFEKGTGYKKYKAIIYENNKKIKTVQFGDRRYEHFKDQVPLKLWSHLDHKDPDRRRNYRIRHSAIKNKDGRLSYKIKYSPAYFSYYYLW